MSNLFDLLFLGFSINIIIFAFFTVTAQNAVQGLIALIFTFLGTTALFFMLELEFVGLLILIVYIGAILVLFLYSIMLFNLKQGVKTKSNINMLIVKIFFMFLINFIIVNVIFKEGLFSKENLQYAITFFNYDSELLLLIQTELKILLDLTHYDFEYGFKHIIYTFFDIYNEILDLVNKVPFFVENFTYSYLYNNYISNINSELYILAQFFYGSGIIYLILTGIVLLIGMFGAITLINSPKPVMQIQYPSRQISTLLENRVGRFE